MINKNILSEKEKKIIINTIQYRKTRLDLTRKRSAESRTDTLRNPRVTLPLVVATQVLLNMELI